MNGHLFEGGVYSKLSVNGAVLITAQNMKFFTKDFLSKCDQICSFLRICSHLLKKCLVENFIFGAAKLVAHSLLDQKRCTVICICIGK